MTKKKKQIEPAFGADSKAHPVLKQLFCYCFYKSALRMRWMYDEELDSLGLVAPQGGILKILNHYGAISQNDLGRELCIDKATMVMLLDGLEAKKFVRRVGDRNDRRVKLVEITAAGLRAIDDIAEIRKQVEERFLEPLTAEERKVLRQAMPKLLK